MNLYWYYVVHYFIQDLHSLDWLYLENNQLKSLPARAFDPINHPSNLYLRLMTIPINCDEMCLITEARDSWISIQAGDCESPSHVQGTSIKSVSVEDLNCEYGANIIANNCFCRLLSERSAHWFRPVLRVLGHRPRPRVMWSLSNCLGSIMQETPQDSRLWVNRLMFWHRVFTKLLSRPFDKIKMTRDWGRWPTDLRKFRWFSCEKTFGEVCIDTRHSSSLPCNAVLLRCGMAPFQMPIILRLCVRDNV